MVKKSAALPEIPKGTKRRMPHVVNYLHGSVHYNGMWLIFNNFDEAKYFFSDKAFRKEFKRIVKTEKREVTLIFRERNYDPVEYAYFSGFIMSNFPWFANVDRSKIEPKLYEKYKKDKSIIDDWQFKIPKPLSNY